MLERPPWSAVEVSIGRFDFTRVETRVRALCFERATVAARGREAFVAFNAALDATLGESVGPWYGYGRWRVGNAVLSSAQTRLAIDTLQNPRRGSVEVRVYNAVRWVEGELTRMIELLRAFEAIYREAAPASPPFARTASFARDALEVLDEVFVPYGGQKGWLSYALDGVAWLFDARGVTLSDEVSAALTRLAAGADEDALRTIMARFELGVSMTSEALGLPRAEVREAVDVPLHARLFTPERPRLDEVRAAVAGVSDPRVAWDVLIARGLVPLSFADDSGRVFRSDSGGVHPVPPTVAACVTFASDVAGACKAEALASELTARLRPWGVRPATRVVWHLTDPVTLVGKALCHPPGLSGVVRVVGALCDRVGQMDAESAEARRRGVVDMGVAASEEDAYLYPALRDAHSRIDRALRTLPVGAPGHALKVLWRRAAAWRLLRDAGFRMPTREQMSVDFGLGWAGLPLPPRSRGVPPRFADLPDPFEPLLALWGTGYSIGAINDRTVTLVGPLLDVS